MNLKSDEILVANVLDIKKKNNSESGIWSKSFCKTKNLNATLMKISADEDLTEHTSSYPAVIQVLEGKGSLIMDGKPVEIEKGSWIYMPAGTAHELSATENLIFVLELIR